MPSSQAQRTLIAPTSAGGTSPALIIGKNFTGPQTIFASNLQGAETADIQFRTLDPSNEWVDLYEDGSQVQLTATNNAEVISAPGVYRVVLAVTAADCGVYLSGPSFPGEMP